MRRQRGAALLLALGVAAGVAVLASEMLTQDRIALRAAAGAAARAQLRHIALAGTAWGQGLLDDDAVANRADTLREAWALPLPPTSAEGVRISGAITDLQGRFNVNTLVAAGRADARAVDRFRRLLGVLELDPGLAEALVDWLDADDAPFGPHGAEAARYAALSPPRSPANRDMIEVAELGAVHGFTPEVCARLAPFVTALPARTAINVNTAPAEVLVALVDGLPLEAARRLEVERRADPYLQPDTFLSALPASAVPRSATGLAVGSRFFLIEVTAERDEAVYAVRTLVERSPGQPSRVLHRSLP